MSCASVPIIENQCLGKINGAIVLPLVQNVGKEQRLRDVVCSDSVIKWQKQMNIYFATVEIVGILNFPMGD